MYVLHSLRAELPVCSLILQTRVHLSCIHWANIYKGSAVSWALVAGSVFGEMTKTWPLTSGSSGIEEVKVKIFKCVQTRWGVCLTQMQWLFVCLFYFYVWQFLHTYGIKGRPPTSLLCWNVFFIWTKRIMYEFQSFSLDFLRNFLNISISLA